MKESPTEKSPRDSIEIDRDRCSVYTTHTTLHTNTEERAPIQVRMRRSIHNIVGQYLDKNMSYGQFYEQSAILFMDLNPKNFSPLVVNNAEKTNQSFDDELEDIILVEELSNEMKHLHLGKKIHITKKKKLLKLLKRCQKLDVRGEKLESLMKEAMNYITKSDV